MALRGEGDPRWVVKERQDGRNVNSWHWEDKDVTGWAELRLKQLITGETCSSDSPSPGVTVKSVETVGGDATLYNRKGVLKVLYDLKVSGKWTSRHEEENACTYGDFKVELFDEDPEVVTTVDSKSQSDGSYKVSFVKMVAPVIQSHCKLFIKELHAGADQFVDGLCIPGAKTQEGQAKTTLTSRTEISRPEQKTKKSGASGTTEIVMIETFTCRTDDWFLTLTDPARLSVLTRSRATSEGRVGGRWEVLGGAASGEYLRLVPSQELEMRWRLKSWGDDAQSGIVHVVLRDEEGKTEARVTVNGVPKEKSSETEGFWRVQILQAMRIVMGWGSASKFAFM